MTDRPAPLVDVTWLHDHLDDPDVIVLDASIPPNDAGGRSIPGARRFDLEGEFSRPGPLPHTMPGAAEFETAARRLGVTSGTTVVVYDVAQLYSAARAWWMFASMGHERVAVLDGGLAAWAAAGYPVQDSAPQAPSDELGPTQGAFVAAPVEGRIVDADAVAEALSAGDVAVVDARSHARFVGEAPEPRPGLRGGHMPGAANLPFTDVQQEGRMLKAPELTPLVDEAMQGRDTGIMSCGSGVTACVIALAATLTGRRISVYDGSWTEWGDPDSGRPVVTGE